MVRWAMTTEERARLGWARCAHDDCLASPEMAKACAEFSLRGDADGDDP